MPSNQSIAYAHCTAVYGLEPGLRQVLWEPKIWAIVQ